MDRLVRVTSVPLHNGDERPITDYLFAFYIEFNTYFKLKSRPSLIIRFYKNIRHVPIFLCVFERV